MSGQEVRFHPVFCQVKSFYILYCEISRIEVLLARDKANMAEHFKMRNHFLTSLYALSYFSDFEA